MKIGNFIIFLLLAFNTVGQTVTFNKRLQFGCASTIFTGMEVTDSCYYLTGVARHDTNCQVSIVFVKFDMLGNDIFYNILPAVFERNEAWAPSLRTDTDGNLVVSQYRYDTIGMQGAILKYNHFGNLL